MPPIRAIRTGRAPRPRCPRSRSPRCGPARRSTTSPDKWKDDRQGQRAGREAGGQANSARGSAEGDHGISRSGAADKTGSGKLLFAGLFDTLNAQRSSVLNGLERVTRKQREAADKIRADTLALQALQGATPPDQTKIDELGNQLVWQTRIFEDRRRVIKFVCEVPTAIDQRLFALGRIDPAGDGIADASYQR